MLRRDFLRFSFIGLTAPAWTGGAVAKANQAVIKTVCNGNYFYPLRPCRLGEDTGFIIDGDCPEYHASELENPS